MASVRASPGLGGVRNCKDQVQEDPLLLLLEEDAVEEVDKIELSEISPVAKRRKKYVIEDRDSE